MEASHVREQLNNNETIMNINNLTEEEEMHAWNAAREAFLVVDFLVKSDMKQFGSLLVTEFQPKRALSNSNPNG